MTADPERDCRARGDEQGAAVGLLWVAQGGVTRPGVFFANRRASSTSKRCRWALSHSSNVGLSGAWSSQGHRGLNCRGEPSLPWLPRGAA